MEKGKNIKQIADELGVSKQAIHQKRKSKGLSTSLQPFTTTVDGIVYIAVDGEKLLKQAFFDKERKQVDDNEPTTVVGVVVGILQATIDTLQGQLEVKDKQIEQLQKELEKEREHSRVQAGKIAILADQAQQLQLAQIHPQLTAGAVEAPREKKRWFNFFR